MLLESLILVCQKVFTAENGTIASPNYPKASVRPFKCTYKIIAKPYQAIRVSFMSTRMNK